MNNQKEGDRVLPPKVKLSCAKLLTKTCSSGFELYDEKRQLENLKHMKKDISSNGLATESFPDLEENYIRMISKQTNTINALEEKIVNFQTIFIKDALMKLESAVNISHEKESDHDAVLLAEKEARLQLYPHEKEFNRLDKQVTTLMETKLGVERLDNIKESINQLSKYLEDTNKEMWNEFNKQFQVNQTIMEVWEAALQKINSESYANDLAQDIKRHMLGLPSLQVEKKEIAVMELSNTVQKSLSDFLRDQFLNQVFPNEVYPTNKKTYTKQKNDPKKIRHKPGKIDALRRDTNKTFALIERNLKGKTIKKQFTNLERFHGFARKHEKFLNFISGPNGERQRNHDSISESKEYLPAQCNLYPRDNRLSSVLATSLVKYTENSFSDLNDRIKALEEKLSK